MLKGSLTILLTPTKPIPFERNAHQCSHIDGWSRLSLIPGFEIFQFCAERWIVNNLQGVFLQELRPFRIRGVLTTAATRSNTKILHYLICSWKLCQNCSVCINFIMSYKNKGNKSDFFFWGGGGGGCFKFHIYPANLHDLLPMIVIKWREGNDNFTSLHSKPVDYSLYLLCWAKWYLSISFLYIFKTVIWLTKEFEQETWAKWHFQRSKRRMNSLFIYLFIYHFAI